MTTETREVKHSPLGASGAERWMNCPGSVALLKRLDLPETDEPQYRSLGTSAHSVAYECLMQGKDAWEFAGETFGQHAIDQEIMHAIQVYLDECASLITPTAKVFYEFSIAAPDFHPDFFGTLDFGVVDGRTIHIRDYKHGVGVAVDCAWNLQLMYYAYGLLRHIPAADTVDLGIVQPRAFHPEGPIRRWTVSADVLRQWAETELKPAMEATAFDARFDAGPWCRFCPAKLVCPLLKSLFDAAANYSKAEVPQLTDEMIGFSYQFVPAVKSYIKALEEETQRRLMAGKQCPGTKLVNKRANRIWKDGADPILVEHLGQDAYTKPELRSPAQLEELGPVAKKLVAEWAYTPVNGYTVALATDKRPAVKVEAGSETFKGIDVS